MVRVISKWRLYLFVAVKGYQRCGSLNRLFHVKKVKVFQSVPCNFSIWESPAEGSRRGYGYGTERMRGLIRKVGCTQEVKEPHAMWAAWRSLFWTALLLFVVQCLRLKYRDKLIPTSTEQRLSGRWQWQHLWCHHLIQKKIEIDFFFGISLECALWNS